MRHDSLLMWSHIYAKSSRYGLGICCRCREGFCASCIEACSLFFERTATDILNFIRSSEDEHCSCHPKKYANEILEGIIYVKSSEWEYEQEYRLAIPNFVTEGANFATLEFYLGNARQRSILVLHD